MTGWDEFAKLVEPTKTQPSKIERPRGDHRGVEWDGREGVLTTGPVEGAVANWDDLLRSWDLDPDEVEVVEPVRRSSWEQQSGDDVVTLNSYRAHLRSKRRSTSDLEQILADVVKHKPPKVAPPVGELAFLHLSGDLQAGKEGSKAMVDRFLAGLSTGPQRLKELRKLGRPIGDIYLPWLGDCIEHVVGHYAQQPFTVELTLTEQIRLVRRLMFKMVQTYAPLTKRLVLPCVPGNHDEAVREGGKSSTTFGDSFAVDIASTVHDMIELNPEVYGHVEIVVPRGVEQEITLDICGTITAMAHGHTFGRDAMKWWAAQAHGMQQPGEATLLLAGHLHHLVVREDGAKAFVQIPALDSGSEWFKRTSGKDAAPGIVTMVVGQGGWDDWKVLR